MKKRGVYWTHYKSSYTQKLKWLRKNKVITKKGGVKKSTVDRLYSFYHRNPLSTPINLAYGYPQRIEKAIEKQKDINLPKGKKITAKKYLKDMNKRTAKQTAKEMSPNISRATFAHRYRSGKRDDGFRYNFRNGKGITANALNVNSILAQLRNVDVPDLMEDLRIFIKNRGFFYKNKDVGALIVYDTQNMPDEPIPRGIKFGEIKDFEKYLTDMLYELLIIDILRHYKDAIIHLKYVEVFIRTRDKPSTIDEMI